MKKILSLMLLSLLVIMFASCDLPTSNNENNTISENNNENNSGFSKEDKSIYYSTLKFSNAYGFSEGVAVVQLYDSKTWALINTNGEILFETESAFTNGCSLAKNGVIILDDTLIKADGTVIASPETTGYDEIITPNNQIGGDYFFVKKQLNTYEETAVQIGILNINGSWVLEPKSDFTGNNDLDMSALECYYLGDNHYSIRWYYGEYIYNPITSVGFNTNNHYTRLYEVVRYYKGKGIKTDYDGTYSIDDHGNTKKLFDFGGYVSSPDENVFCVCNDNKTNNGLYDFDGNLLIDLSNYKFGNVDSINKELPKYCNGNAVINIENEQDSHFITVVDKTGNYFFEPIKISDSSTWTRCTQISEDKFWLQGDDSKFHYYNLSGNKVIDSISANNITDFNNGLALIYNTDDIYYIDEKGNRVIG